VEIFVRKEDSDIVSVRNINASLLIARSLMFPNTLKKTEGTLLTVDREERFVNWRAVLKYAKSTADNSELSEFTAIDDNTIDINNI
jgi:hypothetical protein